MSSKKAQKKTATTQATQTPAPAGATASAEPSKRAKKAAAKKAAAPAPAPAPAEEEWTLVTNKRRGGRKAEKKGKKAEEQAEEQGRREGQAGFGGRGGQGHRDFRNRKQHVAEEIVPIEHSTAVASVVLFVTNEEEEGALRKALEGRPFDVVAVAGLEGVCHFADASKVRVLGGIEAVRGLMKELGVSIFVLPVDDRNLPAPRMSEEVSTMLDLAVRAGAYALTVSVVPVASQSGGRLFFAAVPTHESKQLLVNTLGVVDDESVRQSFVIEGFDIPEAPGMFDIYTSLMNSAVKKCPACAEADVLRHGDQFVQDIAAETKKAAHFPVFTVSFKVGRLDSYELRSKVVYEIHSDDAIPDTLKNIFILLGEPVRQKLTITVCKYQGQVKYQGEDPEKKVDVEFEKIIYSYSSLTDTPVYELYLPRYVDPAAKAVPAPAPAAAPAPVPETEKASS